MSRYFGKVYLIEKRNIYNFLKFLYLYPEKNVITKKGIVQKVTPSLNEDRLLWRSFCFVGRLLKNVPMTLDVNCFIHK